MQLIGKTKKEGLLKSIVNKAMGMFSSQPVGLNPSNYNNSQSKGWFFGMGGGQEIHFDFTGNSSIRDAYLCCPPVSSIINKHASAFIGGKTWLLDGKGKEATGPIAESFKKFLKNPNPLQTWTQWEAQMITFTMLYEYCVLLPVVSVGYEDDPPSAVWVIPGDIVEFEMNPGAFYNTSSKPIKNVIINCAGERSVIDGDKVWIIKGPASNLQDSVLPQSRIKPIAKNINNIIGIYESKNALINYRGSMGILTQEKDTSGMGHLPMPESEKDDIQSGLMRYGLRGGQRKYIVTSASLKWQSMIIPYKDLMFSEWAQDDTMVICDALNYPYRLLAQEKSASYNDVKEFKKLLYQDYTIPTSKWVYEQLTSFLKLDQHGLHLDKDYSSVYALQDDEKDKATARKARNEALQIEFLNNLLTLDRWRELNDEDAVGGEFGGKYYYELVAMGWSFGSMKPEPAKEQNDA